MTKNVAGRKRCAALAGTGSRLGYFHLKIVFASSVVWLCAGFKSAVRTRTFHSHGCKYSQRRLTGCHLSIYHPKKTSSTCSSQAVSHPSTIQAQCCLTSVIGRELVCSTRYGRSQGISSKWKQIKKRYVKLKNWNLSKCVNRIRPSFSSKSEETEMSQICCLFFKVRLRGR